ncbi:AAA family ATPase [Pantoea rodasii]|uniref:AAA family ATPase n=1 Tax=Pantoea rodasii TaxID=1076549 RepID=UPI0013019F8C|nr:AAA family ATPase [Pantoea rodasii]
MIELKLEDEGKEYERVTEVTSYLPQDHANHHHHDSFERRKLIKFEINRNFDYQGLGSISADRHIDDSEVSQQLNTGVNLYNIKDWLAKRILFEKVEPGYAPNILKNIDLAKKCISILDINFSFSRVDPRSYDIYVNTPSGEIWYEYLSSGFKSCLSLLLGIIKEIELRFPEKELYAPDFDGVILIDELELHLHPEWQARITDALTTTFPSAQFIVTTHSPHIVQNAKSHQIMALVYADNGEVCMKNLPDNGFGYSAWTVEEVLLDIMGMESTLSRKLQHQLDDFDRFVDAEDFDEAKKSMIILMLPYIRTVYCANP